MTNEWEPCFHLFKISQTIGSEYHISEVLFANGSSHTSMQVLIILKVTFKVIILLIVMFTQDNNLSMPEIFFYEFIMSDPLGANPILETILKLLPVK